MNRSRFKPIYILLTVFSIWLLLFAFGYFEKPPGVRKPAIKKENKAADKVLKAEAKKQAELAKKVEALRQADQRQQAVLDSLENEFNKLNHKEYEIRRMPAPANDNERSRILSGWYD